MEKNQNGGQRERKDLIWESGPHDILLRVDFWNKYLKGDAGFEPMAFGPGDSSPASDDIKESAEKQGNLVAVWGRVRQILSRMARY